MLVAIQIPPNSHSHSTAIGGSNSENPTAMRIRGIAQQGPTSRHKQAS